MNYKFKIQDSKIIVSEHRSKFLVSLIFFLQVIFTFSCSIPNLEKPECIESKEIVKQFYSFHFGNDMKPTPENLNRREKYLSRNLFEESKTRTETAKDYFTQTDDYPKAFRVSGCEVLTPEKTLFEILIFWKTETRTEQRTIKVETIKENGNWLIDKVENK
ncbi:MAG: DUF3828 domain-containing protein [Pyrinomonadaceae bacterium]